ncbi:hypothetical protein FRC10_000611 [Ceratobasidium sp. 414]|nr:hypothetical protein FRC10_000611 [Ceratobasidium sp. 414]
MTLKKNPDRPEEQIPENSRDGDKLWSFLLRCWSYEAVGRPTAVQVEDMMKTISREGLSHI